METMQQEIRAKKHIAIKLLLIMLFILLGVSLFIGAFLWLDHILAYNLERVHPDEVEVRDWLWEKDIKFSRYADSERHIKGVYFDGHHVTTEDLKRLTQLTQLRTLTLNNTNVTDEFVPYINELKSLRDLEVNGTKITWEGMCKLDVYGIVLNDAENTELETEHEEN